MKTKWKLSKLTEHKYFTLALMLIIIFAGFGILTKGAIVKPLSIRNILNLMAVTSLLCCGQACVMLTGEIDLSCGAVGTCGGVVLAHVSTTLGLPWWCGIIAGCLAGALFGFVNATMVNKFKMESFISSIALHSIGKGLGYAGAGSIGIAIANETLETIGSGKIFNKLVPISVIIALTIFIIYGIMLSKSKIGRKMYLLGGNKVATRLVGINPTAVSYFAFINSGICAAMAGMLYSCRVFNATAAGITSQQFIGIECAMLGGIAVSGGEGGMIGVFLGMMIINVFNYGLDLTGVDPYWKTAFTGIILIVAMFLYFINKKRQRKASIAKMNEDA